MTRIFYRVNSAPPAIELTQADAKKSAKQLGVSWEQIDIPTDKRGLAAFVQELWNDQQPIDEGFSNSPHSSPAEGFALLNKGVASEVNAVSHVNQLVAFDDEFEKMPLARQLHYASLAMENAREVLP